MKWKSLVEKRENEREVCVGRGRGGGSQTVLVIASVEDPEAGVESPENDGAG